MNFPGHLRVAREAWQAETKRRQGSRAAWRHTEFLPAALEVTETPPSPLGRILLWCIIGAAVLAIGWAVFSFVDTVSVAEGRLTPTGRLRTLEAADAGIVRAIAVHEGDHVRAGQMLIALDPTVAQADAQSAQSELASSALVSARAAALLRATAGRSSRIITPLHADAAVVSAEQAAVDARVHEFTEHRASLEARRTAAQADVRLAQANIAKIEQSLPLARQQVDAYDTLAKHGFGSTLRLAQEQERYVGLRNDLDAEKARRDEALAQSDSLARDIAQAVAEFRSTAAKEAAEAEAQMTTRGDEVRKADQRRALQTLRAPMDGVVQEISVTTLGQVAEAGKPIVTLVPQGEPLVAEVLVLNRDVGAIHVGDRVVLKLEAYPYTRYGVLIGHVARVSPDSIVDEKRGLVFPTVVTLDRRQSRAVAALHLQPGMATTAEIITGRRRIIQYLWSPIARATHEAGRER